MQCKRIPALHISMEPRSSLSQFSPRIKCREPTVRTPSKSRFQAFAPFPPSGSFILASFLVHTYMCRNAYGHTPHANSSTCMYVRRGSTNYRYTLLAASPLLASYLGSLYDLLSACNWPSPSYIDGEQSCSDSRQAA